MGTRLIAVMIILLGEQAQAAPIDDAKVEFAAGKEAFEHGDYEKALNHYIRANQLVPAPSLEYNIGNCHERLGHYKEAAASFDRYLELTGQPNTDDEKDFQEKLRARITANKKRSETTQAIPPPVYQQPIYQPPPTYYVPAVPPPPPREYLLKTARRHRANAIALMATGLALHVIGMGLLIDGLVTPHGSCETIIGGNCVGTTTSGINIAEDFFGVTFMVVGVTLWAPGAASYVSSERQIRDLTKQDPGTGPAAPKAFLFHSPVFRF